MKSAYGKILGIGLVCLGLSLGVTNSLKAEEKAPTHCSVHQEKLKQDNVRIRYGLPVYDKGYWEARRKFFPHSNMYVEGGCVIMEDSPKTAKVDYCPKCRVAEAEWTKARAKEKKQ